MTKTTVLSTRNRVYIIGAALIALFLGAMDALIMSVSMPTIVAELGGLHLYAWVYSGFSLTSAISLPIFGKLADIYPTKRLFIIAISLFIIASIAAGLSNNMLFLVITRAIQGIGAGGNMALVYIVLSDVALPEKRAKTLALASFVWGIASVIGPSIGGVITTYLSWRWIFFINVPIGLISMIGVGVLFTEMRDKKASVSIDYAGAATLAGTIFCGLTIILAAGNQFAWLSLPTVIFAVLTVGFGWAFFKIEASVAEPILSLTFFKRRGFALGNGSVFLASFAIFSLFAYTPLFIQGALRKSPLEVGSIMLSISLGWSIGPIILSRFLHRVSNRFAIGSGAALIAIGSGYTLTFSATTIMIHCFIAFTLTGIGMGFITLCTLLVVQASLSERDLGVATSSQQFSRTLGGTIGVGIAGAVATSRLASQLGKAGDAVPSDILTTVTNNMEAIFKPEFFSPLPAAVQNILQNAVVSSITAVFWIVFGAAILALIFAMLLPKEAKPTA